MGKTAIFVSDVHLYYGGGAYLRTFLDFLEEVPALTQSLFIHGDLFDFYVGPRQGKREFYAPLFEALERLVKLGVEVRVFHGNRDFLAGREFAARGVRMVQGGLSMWMGPYRVHVSHGDQFCIHDRSYQFWARGVLRSFPIRFLVGRLPVCASIWLARRYRGVSSRKLKRGQTGGPSRLDSVLDGVKALLSRDPHDIVVCGHIHQLAETEIVVGGKRSRLLTTGAWEEGPNHLYFDGLEFHLCRHETRAANGTGPAPSAPQGVGESPAQRLGVDSKWG